MYRAKAGRSCAGGLLRGADECRGDGAPYARPRSARRPSSAASWRCTTSRSSICASGEIRGAEALLRWHHPEHGLISPVRFIPLAEESGFIEQLGRWTLGAGLRADAGLARRRADARRVSVNVSPRQFRKAGTLETISRVRPRSGLSASMPRARDHRRPAARPRRGVEGLLREMHDAGLRIALDDFGTGFSSMSYLKRFPVDTIKIDRVFVDGARAQPDSEAIVAAIIAMSHALGKTVVAEGVETAGAARVPDAGWMRRDPGLPRCRTDAGRAVPRFCPRARRDLAPRDRRLRILSPAATCAGAAAVTEPSRANVSALRPMEIPEALRHLLR